MRQLLGLCRPTPTRDSTPGPRWETSIPQTPYRPSILRSWICPWASQRILFHALIPVINKTGRHVYHNAQDVSGKQSAKAVLNT
jgi:hypothetical protein